MTEQTGVPRKRALLIGINEYPLLSPLFQLTGCVNDVDAMADLLRGRFNFRAEDVTVLKDRDASQRAILAAMDELEAQTAQGDTVVFHYSGHGSQMTDREGDEPDGIDETIMPSDSGRAPHPNRDISDDVIYEWLLKLTRKTANVTLIFDSCHSGTITRDLLGAGVRRAEPDLRPVEELPPSPVSPQLFGGGRRDAGPSGWLPLGQRYVLLAACKDMEGAYEHSVTQGGEVVRHGAFTFFLMQEMEHAGPSSTFRDIFERASVQLVACYPQQHPQLEGTRDRLLFGLHDVEPMRFIPVRRRAEREVVLGAGAAHGLTVGSKWAVYAQGTKQVAEETPKLGVVRITSVGAVTSKSTVVEEDGVALIKEGDRAVEEVHDFGDARLSVRVIAPGDNESAARLRKEVGKYSLLRLAEDGGPADARVYLIGPRAAAAPDDPAPQLQELAEETWAAVGENDLLLVPTLPAASPEGPAVLCANLEKYSRYQKVLALKNPWSGLDGKVSFSVLRLSGDGDWRDTALEDEGDAPVFEAGDRIAFRITNRHSAPLYVNILDFGLSGTVSLLYPVAGANEYLVPTRSVEGTTAQGRIGTFEVGVRDGEVITLYIPAAALTASRLTPPGADENGGFEIFKLLVTTEEADFSWIVQPGYRGFDRRGCSPLEELLHSTLTGEGLRETLVNRTSPESDWAAVDRRIFLKRKGL